VHFDLSIITERVSSPSVRPFPCFHFAFSLTDLCPGYFACTWFMIIVHWGLKVEVRGNSLCSASSLGCKHDTAHISC